MLHQILTVINQVILILFMVGFGSQMIFILLFFLPAKRFKPSTVLHKVGIIICAKNEEKVIGHLLKSIDQLNYPKSHYDVYVIADNCTDATASIAKQNGAIVFERHDANPKHHRLSYALQFGFQKIIETNIKYDFFVKFDADNIVCSDYLHRMNDAFASGSKLAKGYNNAKNIDENVIAAISGLWYIRDNRFTCQVRSALNLSQLLTGPGMMISSEIIHKNNGWKHLGISEDADFALDELLHGTKADYVSEAIFYDDQPHTIKDVFKRNMRMGRGLIYTFFKYGIPCLWMFFRTGKFTYLDMFLTEFFIPMALIGVTWFPIYYTYDIVFQFTISYEAGMQALLMLGLILLFGFIVAFILQALLVYGLEHKKIKGKPINIFTGILLFPFFMVLYALGITLGIIFKPKWKSIERSKMTGDQLME